DPVLWAFDLSHAVSGYEQEILQEACRQIVRGHKWCPSISEIVEWCEMVDREIGGQKTMGMTMVRMYAWDQQTKERCGYRGWQKQWGPVPGESECRLRPDRQQLAWNGAIEYIEKQLTDASEPQPLGCKIVAVLEKNCGTIFGSGGAWDIPATILMQHGLKAA